MDEVPVDRALTPVHVGQGRASISRPPEAVSSKHPDHPEGPPAIDPIRPLELRSFPERESAGCCCRECSSSWRPGGKLLVVLVTGGNADVQHIDALPDEAAKFGAPSSTWPTSSLASREIQSRTP